MLSPVGCGQINPCFCEYAYFVRICLKMCRPEHFIQSSFLKFTFWKVFSCLFSLLTGVAKQYALLKVQYKSIEMKTIFYCNVLGQGSKQSL